MFDTWYWIVLGIVVALPFVRRFLKRWIAVPIRMRRTHHMTMSCNLQHATAEQITPELRQTLQSILPQFRAEGFESAAMNCNTGTVPGVNSVAATLVNRETGDLAIIIATWAKSTRSVVYAVRSEFTDDTIVSTSVDHGVGVLPLSPSVSSVGFSRLPSIHVLCEFHRRRLRHLGVDEKPRYPFPPGSEIDRFNREYDRTTKRLVQIGYIYPDQAAQVFRYTWKAAFLCSWRITPPIEGLRIKLHDRRALALWRELKMPGNPTDGPTVDELPAQPARATPDPTLAQATGSNLNYEVGLAEGEIRVESTPAGVTVRMGRPSIPRYLARNWISLIWIVICAAGLSFFLFQLWMMQRLALRLGLPFRFFFVQLSFVPLIVFLILRILKLIRSALMLRGTIVLTATEAGLEYRNIPAFRGSGQIARSELKGLMVVSAKVGWGKKVHMLCALLRNARPLLLLATGDAERLEQLTQVRSRLVHAMGIEVAAPGENESLVVSSESD